MRKKKKRIGSFLAAAALICTVTVTGVWAYLTVVTPEVNNTFQPGKIKITAQDTMNGNQKSNITVKNDSDTAVYIRVKLVSYWTNSSEQTIGGSAEIPKFTLNTNWVEGNGYYYYTIPVGKGLTTTPLTTETITLKTSTTSNGFGPSRTEYQVIEVLAEAVQSEPANAVSEVWGFNPAQGSNSVGGEGA